ncbi:MAG: hypothetical protein KA267_04195 [Gemmatimonadales bacterium]|jgi:hypothetical protein|nr:hypothetical protein [Gemmatimonadales bacterium]MBP6571721.1 hypothetical protein [Gemmatimonadales bacterium]
MEPEAVFFLLMLTTAGSSFMWYRAVQARKRIEARLWGLAAGQGLPIAAMLEGEPTGAMPAMSRGDASRVERLEHQVDQMAQQMERISESQDFISRVLTDRIEQLPDPRMRTPH